MNNKTAAVFAGFLRLSEPEKAELQEAVRDYMAKSQAGRVAIEEAYKTRKVVLGPLRDDVCPCCGR